MSKRWYGSFTNRMMEHNAIKDIKVGDGATLTSYSDRYAGTVTEIYSKGKAMFVIVQEDKSKRIDKNGMSESQEYEYSPDPNGAIHVFKLLPGRAWTEVKMNDKGRYVKYDGLGLRVGDRDEHYDFSF